MFKFVFPTIEYKEKAIEFINEFKEYDSEINGSGALEGYLEESTYEEWLMKVLKDIDIANVGIVGHSRLGKTALWAAANDQRFRFVHSNDSGTSGAALYRERNDKSESIKDICERFPYWFNKNFPKYIDMESKMAFDQDDLIKCIAPRIVSIGSASEDLWANPQAEMLSAKNASIAWTGLGERGLENISDEAQIGVNYHDGKVGYYVREGRHCLSRNDWNRFLDFFDKNICSLS